MKKKLSRQRRWQLKQKAQGKCIICGHQLYTATHCLKHAIAHRSYQRKVA